MFELFQPNHLLFVALVALGVFGPERMMEVGRSLGQGIQKIQEFKEEIKDELTTPAQEEEDPRKKHPPKEKG